MVKPKYTFKVVAWTPKYDGVPGHWFGDGEEWKRRAMLSAEEWRKADNSGQVTAVSIRDNFNTGRHPTWKPDRTWGVVVEQETENEYGEICP